MHLMQMSRNQKRSPKLKGLLAKHLTGRACLICGVKRSPANTGVPLIHLGKYRTFMACKKKHFSSEIETNKLIEAIDRELKVLREKGDHDIFGNSSDEEATEDRVNESSDKRPCQGYAGLNNGVKPCSDMADSFLWIENEHGDKAYFCKGSHAARYIMKNFGRKGRSSKADHERDDEMEEEDPSEFIPPLSHPVKNGDSVTPTLPPPLSQSTAQKPNGSPVIDITNK